MSLCKILQRILPYHIIAFFLGFVLDLIVGDPYCLPHPVRIIGKLITVIEDILTSDKFYHIVQHIDARESILLAHFSVLRYKLQKKEIFKKNIKEIDGKEIKIKEIEIKEIEIKEKDKDKNKTAFRQGISLVVMIVVSVVAVVFFLLIVAYGLHPYLGLVLEMIMTYQILAVKCLKVESMKVYSALKNGDLEQAKAAVSMIVGRDTACLDAEGVAKAAIETVAENTSDGVIAPMLYLALGGPILGFFYKAVNTMDSMVGYKNDKYLYFGRAAAKLDDVVNFIPSRMSAGFMIAASFLVGMADKNFSGKEAYRIYRRDCRKHASPNSAQTESVCAGALGIQFAGDASYFGKIVKKPYIGDALRRVEYTDIRRANRLMYVTAWLCEIICLIILLMLL